MTSWTQSDRERIGATDELQLASLKKDGMLRKPVTIWVVGVGDDLYVRAFKGREGTWFRHAQQRSEGRISVGGLAKKVAFVDVSNDEKLNSEIDTAFRAKYRQYGSTYVEQMLTPQARATTLKLVPSA